MATKVSTIEIDMTQLDEILRRIDANELTEGDCEALRTLCKAYVQLTELLKDKNTSLARLRKLLFGAATEKTQTVVGNGKDSPSASPQAVPLADQAAADQAAKSPRKGHGRNAADAYTGAEKIEVRHPSLQPGDPCPKCDEGTVYETGRPGVLVQLVGQSPLDGFDVARGIELAVDVANQWNAGRSDVHFADGPIR